MQIVVWVLATVVLLGLAALLASVIDRRAGWNQIPLQLDSSRDTDDQIGVADTGSRDPDEHVVEAPVMRPR